MCVLPLLTSRAEVEEARAVGARVETERRDSWEHAAVRGLDWWRALRVT